MNIAEKIIRALPAYWFSFVTKTDKRYLFFKIFSIVILGFFIFIIASYFILTNQEFTIWKIRWLIWSLLFVASVWFIRDERMNSPLFYVMFVWLIIINYVLWIIPLMLVVYLIYLGLEAHRINRLKAIANSSPEALAGIKDKPKVIIQVRKD